VETNADSTRGSSGVRSILFVCTGNTCRSPLAESLCKARLARALGCTTEQLSTQGFIVQSAGLAALPGQPAALEAVQVAQELEADLRQHQSQLLTEALLQQATHVFVMTQHHQLLLLDYFPDTGPAPTLLSPTGADLDDPIGCELAVYRDCGQAILQALDVLLPALQKGTMESTPCPDEKAGEP
jgi:protein-tyrosine phosphatase